MSKPRTRCALRSGLAIAALSMALGGAAHNAKADGTEMSFTPRVWYNLYTDSRYSEHFTYDGPFAAAASASTAYELPFYGGTVTLKNPQIFGAGTLAVTVLNGDANSRTSGVFSYAPDAGRPYGHFYNVSGDNDVHRLDAEALFILPVKSSASLFMGARYIGFDFNRSLHIIEEPDVAIRYNETNDAYYGELGVGLSAPISDNGRHMLFANLIVLAGLQNAEQKFDMGTNHKQTWSGGIDANVGYAYQMTQDVKFSARYRLFERSDLNHWGSGGSELMHGPELGLTYSIGRTESLK